MCNPLLDITIKVDKSILKKYNLVEDTAILASQENEKIIDEIQENNNPMYTLGGSGQNTARVIQWLPNNPFIAVYTGCIGEDNNADIMISEAEKHSIRALYSRSSKSTGVCLCLITGSKRTLIAKLAASCDYSLQYLEKIWQNLEDSNIYYCTSYFSCFESSMKVAMHACHTNKLFCYNLSSELMCEIKKHDQMTIMPYIDVLFGNHDEFKAFAKFNMIEYNSLEDIAIQISKFPKNNQLKPRKVIITCSENPTIFYDGYDIFHIPTCFIVPDDIVDSNGCGDGFVAGVLHQVNKTGNFIDGIKLGNYLGSIILKQVGVSLSEEVKPSAIEINEIIEKNVP